MKKGQKSKKSKKKAKPPADDKKAKAAPPEEAKKQEPAKQEPPKPAEKKPDPPAQKNAETDKAKTNCPETPPKVCNTSSLKVTVTPYKQKDPADKPDENKMELTAPEQLRGTKIGFKDQKALGKVRCKELDRYDLIIEALASQFMKATAAKSPSKFPETLLSIAAAATWDGTCGEGTHPAIWMEPSVDPEHSGRKMVAFLYRGSDAEDMTVRVTPTSLQGDRPSLGNKISFPVGTPGFTVRNVSAPASPGDTYSGGPVFSVFFRLFDLFLSLFMETAIELEIVADSCGAPPKGGKANKNLNALVRVYRDITIGISVTIPKGQKISYEEKGDYSDKFAVFRDAAHHTDAEVKAGTKTTIDYRTLPAPPAGSTPPPNTELRPGVYSVTLKINDFEIPIKEEDKTAAQTRSELISKLQSETTVIRTGAQAKASSVWTELQARFSAAQAGFSAATPTPPTGLSGLKLTVWTQAQKIAQFFRELIKFRNLWDEITTAFRKAPKLGWFLEWELTVLSASVTFSITRKSDTSLLPDRLVRLVPNGKIELALTLIEAKVLLGFGIILDFTEIFRLEAFVSVSVTGSLGCKTEGSILDDTPFGVSESIIGAVGIRAEARAGHFVAVAEGELKWGFAVDAAVTWKRQNGRFEGTVVVKTLPLTASLFASAPILGSIVPKSVKLVDGFLLADEKFPRSA